MEDHSEGIFQRLKKTHLFAISAIVFAVIISQIILQINLSSQAKLSNDVNRQIILRQEITQKSINKSDQILSKEKLDSAFLALKNKLEKSDYSDTIKNTIQGVDSALGDAKQKERFLKSMNYIEKLLEEEERQKMKKLVLLQYVLFAFVLFVCFLAFFLLLMPISYHVKNSIYRIATKNTSLEKALQEVKHNNLALEKSVRELKAMHYAMDLTLFYGRLNKEGKIITLGSRFLQHFSANLVQNAKFSEYLTSIVAEQTDIETIIQNNYQRGYQGEIKITQKNQPVWLEFSLIPVVIEHQIVELLVICSDITLRKQAQFELERLNEQRHQEMLNHQKVISLRIVESQENEQNRIAKEIHDGIGQMLTGLKFSLESIDLQRDTDVEAKLENIKKIISDIIKGIRAATFNLMPPELTDYGLVHTLPKLANELSKFTGKNIVFVNQTQFDKKLDYLTEINIYRITQEAINNAIKYAESEHIIVILSHSKEILSISISDDGIGFDKKAQHLQGMGMIFMNERAGYIGGRLFVQSEPKEGTKITLNVPLSKTNS